MPGRFLAFEGIDGAGKSTQARRLADHLAAAGHDVVLTREPGGAPGAEEIRHLLVGGAPERWSPETEILLFTAARRDHLERTIRPALDAGRVVITDRFADSTRVYQGAARADLRGLVDRLHAELIGLEPDLTFLIEMDPAMARSRRKRESANETRFESFATDFHARLRDGFRTLAGEHADRYRVLDGARPPEDIAEDIAALAEAALT